MDNIKSLPAGYILQGKVYKYEIKEVLGHGAFGITYLASVDVEVEGPLGKFISKTLVTLKEFFMSEINGRNEASVTTGGENTLYEGYKRKFSREAKNLSQLKHKNIVNVLELFETNNTVYYSMEYLHNGSIDNLIEKKGRLSESETLAFTAQICEALKYMHSRQVLHLDIKPKNIMLNDKMEAVLIDFGLSKHYDEQGNPESSTNIGGGTPGYSPLEQSKYLQDGTFQASLDIYALGATMFKMLTGKRPPEASDLLNDGFNKKILEDANVSQNTINVVEKAMMPMKRLRYQTVDEIITDLNSVDESRKPETNTPGIPEPSEQDIETKIITADQSAPEPSEQDDKTEIIDNGQDSVENSINIESLANSQTDLSDEFDKEEVYVQKKRKKKKVILWSVLGVLATGIIAGGIYFFLNFNEFIYEHIGKNTDGEPAVVLNGSQWGYIDENGKEIIPCEYDAADKFYLDEAIVVKNNKWGVINSKGKELVPCNYDYLENHHSFYEKDNDNKHNFNNFMRACKNGKWGIVKKNGSILIPIIYEEIEFKDNGEFLAMKDGINYRFDNNGNKIY